ncbi:MAG: T9SS type A sorting domain-containing protein [Candidatus Kapaibacterium sp.]
MKKFILLLVLVLLCTAPVIAQSPVQDSIPQLKEWWRADNMQYAKYGMTWLENFYQGKGALVVWTPQGVKTWLLRFPGDTMNVFTWEKGSSNIKTGDFNGDGIIDYVDENGYIYEGITNGEPPKPNAIACQQSNVETSYPEVVGDINGDGKDDIINTPRVDHVVKANQITVCFGKTTVQDMFWQTVTLQNLDSNNTVVSGYRTTTGELRLVCRRYYWHYQKTYSVIDRDGLRLVRVWWDGGGFKSEVLDEFTVDTQNGTGIYWVGALHLLAQGNPYYICATQLLGKVDNSDVAIYDLSNDKFEKRSSTRIDRISGIGVLHHSIDGDSIQDWWVRYFQTNRYSDISFYSGAIQNSTQPIGRYNVCQIASLASVPLTDSNPQNAVVIGGNDGDSYYCFRVVKPSEIVGVLQEEPESYPLTIQIISPQPVKSNQSLQIRFSSIVKGNYEVSLYSTTGRIVFTMSSAEQTASSQILSIPLTGYSISKGVYWLRLKVGSEQVQQKLIVD